MKAIDLKQSKEVEFKGSVVACTVSMGVLKNNVIRFEPKLPKWKQDSIDVQEMGVLCKIFMSFSAKFWSDQAYFFLASNQKGYYPTWRPLGLSEDKSKHLVMCLVSGDEARRIERLDVEVIKDEVQALLSKVFQNKIKKWKIDLKNTAGDASAVFRPVDVHVCKWDTDPRFHGSYTFLKVGAFTDDDLTWDHLAEAIDPKFADLKD